MQEVGDLYLKVLDSFVVVFGLAGAFFAQRPWLLPAVPAAILVVFFALRARRAPPAPDARELRSAQRRSAP
jgi:hypothetical protein